MNIKALSKLENRLAISAINKRIDKVLFNCNFEDRDDVKRRSELVRALTKVRTMLYEELENDV